MTTIRCLLNTKISENQTINEYMLKSGKYITEIVTDLGSNEKSVREIYKNSSNANDIEKVVDNIFGKLEIYYPSKYGVVREIDGIKLPILDTTIEKIIKNS